MPLWQEQHHREIAVGVPHGRKKEAIGNHDFASPRKAAECRGRSASHRSPVARRALKTRGIIGNRQLTRLFSELGAYGLRRVCLWRRKFNGRFC